MVTFTVVLRRYERLLIVATCCIPLNIQLKYVKVGLCCDTSGWFLRLVFVCCSSVAETPVIPSKFDVLADYNFTKVQKLTVSKCHQLFLSQEFQVLFGCSSWTLNKMSGLLVSSVRVYSL